jgi:hypothetical protein
MTSVSDAALLTESDLESIGMKPLERRKLLAEAKPAAPPQVGPAFSAHERALGVGVMKHGVDPLLSSRDSLGRRSAAKYLLSACASATARALIYESSDKLRELHALSREPMDSSDWAVNAAVLQAVEELMRQNLSAKYWLTGMLGERDAMLSEQCPLFYDAGRDSIFFSADAFDAPGKVRHIDRRRVSYSLTHRPAFERHARNHFCAQRRCRHAGGLR